MWVALIWQDRESRSNGGPERETYDDWPYAAYASEEDSEIVFGAVSLLNYTRLDVVDFPYRPDFWPSPEEYAQLPMDNFKLKEVRFKAQNNAGAFTAMQFVFENGVETPLFQTAEAADETLDEPQVLKT